MEKIGINNPKSNTINVVLAISAFKPNPTGNNCIKGTKIKKMGIERIVSKICLYWTDFLEIIKIAKEIKPYKTAIMK